MNIEYTAMDDMNHKATDVLECTECESEKLFLLHKQTKEEAEGQELNWLCLDCGHTFHELV
jgi:DNA-directed RNA polymerase subunit M/transcription elongation factor TFIIS